MRFRVEDETGAGAVTVAEAEVLILRLGRIHAGMRRRLLQHGRPAVVSDRDDSDAGSSSRGQSRPLTYRALCRS